MDEHNLVIDESTPNTSVLNSTENLSSMGLTQKASLDMWLARTNQPESQEIPEKETKLIDFQVKIHQT